MEIDYNNYEVIKEIPTQEKTLIIENYPYGFRLKTKIVYWIETKKNQQRLGSKTLNPKTNLWNKPKYSTYADVMILGKDKSNDHIVNMGYGVTYSDKQEYDEFIKWLNDFETDYIIQFKKYANAFFKTREFVKVSVRTTQFKNKYTGEIKEVLNFDELNDYEEITDEEHEQEQKEISKDIVRLFINNAIDEGLTIPNLKDRGVLK